MGTFRTRREGEKGCGWFVGDRTTRGRGNVKQVYAEASRRCLRPVCLIVLVGWGRQRAGQCGHRSHCYRCLNVRTSRPSSDNAIPSSRSSRDELAAGTGLAFARSGLEET
jgi:hypothetical protein